MCQSNSAVTTDMKPKRSAVYNLHIPSVTKVHYCNGGHKCHPQTHSLNLHRLYPRVN